jgi:hypothetical protein
MADITIKPYIFVNKITQVTLIHAFIHLRKQYQIGLKAFIKEWVKEYWIQLKVFAKEFLNKWFKTQFRWEDMPLEKEAYTWDHYLRYLNFKEFVRMDKKKRKV